MRRANVVGFQRRFMIHKHGALTLVQTTTHQMIHLHNGPRDTETPNDTFTQRALTSSDPSEARPPARMVEGLVGRPTRIDRRDAVLHRRWRRWRRWRRRRGRWSVDERDGTRGDEGGRRMRRGSWPSHSGRRLGWREAGQRTEDGGGGDGSSSSLARRRAGDTDTVTEARGRGTRGAGGARWTGRR